MRVYKGENFAEVYKASLEDLKSADATQINSRNLNARELRDVCLEIENPRAVLYNNKRRSSQYKYLAAELLWYFSGSNDTEFIKKYAKFWKQIENEDGTANSAYGYLLFNKKNRYGLTQYDWALSSLRDDQHTRQAILHFNLPEHQYFGCKDVVCTMYGIFHIRENKLYLSIYMRSNDCMWGTPTDIAFFSMLHQQAYAHAQVYYPHLQLGSLSHIANSYHVYSRHYDLLDEMLDHDFESVSFPRMNRFLINRDGTPTSTFETFLNNYEDILPMNDPIYNWIYLNINELANETVV